MCREAVSFVQRITAWSPSRCRCVPAFDFEDRLDILMTLDQWAADQARSANLDTNSSCCAARQKIQKRNQRCLGPMQKEYFRRERMKAIRRELGEERSLTEDR